MPEIMNYGEMEREVNEYFTNLTDEQFIHDLKLADYSFYENITAQFLDAPQITYGKIKVSPVTFRYIKTATKRCYETIDFFGLAEDYKLAA